MKALVLVVLVACGGGAAKPHPTPTPTLPVIAPTPAGVPTTTWDQLKGPVRTVEVTTADAGLRGELAKLFAPEVGQLLDRMRLRDRLVAALAVKGVGDVAARGVQLAGGIKLIIDVTPQPIVRKLGAIEVGGAPLALTGMAAARVGAILDPAAIDRIARDLRDRYRDTGHVNAEAEWHKVTVADGVEIVIEVSPGVVTMIEGVDVTGNKEIASDELRAILAKRLTVGKPALEELIEKAGSDLDELYWERGYANVSIKPPPPPTGAKVMVVYEITENGQYRLGPIAFIGTGAPAASAARFAKLVGIKAGDVFKRSAIARARDTLVTAAKAPGDKDPDVLVTTKVDHTKHTIDITFEILKSP